MLAMRVVQKVAIVSMCICVLCLFKRCMTDDMCMSLNVHYVCIFTCMHCRTESRTNFLTRTIKYIVSYLCSLSRAFALYGNLVSFHNLACLFCISFQPMFAVCSAHIRRCIRRDCYSVLSLCAVSPSHGFPFMQN